MKTILNIILIMIGLTSCMGAKSNDYTNMDVNNFATYLAENPDVQILDVRTPAEFREGHIEGAENIDWYDNNFLKLALDKLDKSRPVAIYCRSGMRSAAAASVLGKNGFNVTNLQGGIIAWENNHEPVVQ